MARAVDHQPSGPVDAARRVLLGAPRRSDEVGETLLPKWLALPLFSSDPLSSVAYASQEILLYLGLAGTAALSSLMPLSGVVAVLLVIVAVSYMQTARAYPNGGGSYTVASTNLGPFAGLVAAAALMADYVMTAAVSSSAGVDAVIAAVPSLRSFRVLAAVALVVLVMVVNLRGVSESGKAFAVPTYLFVVAILTMIGVGLGRCAGGCPAAPSSSQPLHTSEALSFFLILQAFAAGTTALTGVEAIANGVPAFRDPKPKNAARTLGLMAGLAVTMFLGISFLAQQMKVHYSSSADETVLSQVGAVAFGRGIAFYVLQGATALVLVLAANTAFAGFPRLAAVLADDHYLPKQFRHLGDRLNYSNGIMIITAFAVVVILAFGASTDNMIHLYLIGVFVAFTLSQAGLLRHWLRHREESDRWWWARATVNGLGAALTGGVLVVALITKFLEGAYLVVAAVPLLVLLMRAIHGHYAAVEREIERPDREPDVHHDRRNHVVVYFGGHDTLNAGALAYLHSLDVASVDAVAVEGNNDPRRRWEEADPGIPLRLLPDGRTHLHAVREHLNERCAETTDGDFLTFVALEEAEGLAHTLLHHPQRVFLRESTAAQPDVAMLSLTAAEGSSNGARSGTVRNTAVVLVGEMNNAAVRALHYARGLGADEVRALHIAFDEDAEEPLRRDWSERGCPEQLDVVATPVRRFGSTLRRYVQDFQADGSTSFLTVVVPEYVVAKRRHRALHRQTPLLVRRHLVGIPGVVVVNVPYRVDGRTPERGADRQDA